MSAHGRANSLHQLPPPTPSTNSLEQLPPPAPKLGPRLPPPPPLSNLLTTSLRSDPTTPVVGGVGSGLRPAVQSPLQSAGGGGGRVQLFSILDPSLPATAG